MYYRKRFPRKRYARGTDRNSFCITVSENVPYTFAANSNIGYPSLLIDFGIKDSFVNGGYVRSCIGAQSSEKFEILRKLYDQVRLKGMSVKINYVADTGLSAQTLNLFTMIDRMGTSGELNKWRTVLGTNDKSEYLAKFEKAASKKKTTLTGGKTFYMYLTPSNLQERTFVNIDKDIEDDEAKKYIWGFTTPGTTAFNPIIYSYIEKSAATTNSVTNVITNVEVKYYVEFRNSV